MRLPFAASLALFVTLGSGASRAAEPTPLPAAEALQKLSLKVRRTSPTPGETAAFRADAAGGTEAFLRAYTERLDRYLASPEFVTTVEQFHAVWWRVPFGESTKLAAYIVGNDRPYREILARDYLFVDGRLAPFYAQQGVKVETPLPDAPGDYQAVRLSADEPRFRSILGSLDFLNQFPDTATNKNRKRASHVFRAFLCETLSNATPEEHFTRDDDDHANNPDCLGCHVRLDPMARFFDGWRPPVTGGTVTWFDPAEPSSGAVVVRDGGAWSSHPGAGDGELGRLLLGLPQTEACFADKAWELAHGVSVRLDAESRARLVASYRDRGTFKALLREAFLHPYFWSTEEPTPVNYADVKPMVQTCKSCHAPGRPRQPNFDADNYPWRADPAENAAVLRKVFGALAGNPAYRRMPPAPIPALPQESLQRMREWIMGGALDARLSPTLTDAQIEEILND